VAPEDPFNRRGPTLCSAVVVAAALFPHLKTPRPKGRSGPGVEAERGREGGEALLRAARIAVPAAAADRRQWWSQAPAVVLW
jgi:hypothetical protein